MILIKHVVTKKWQLPKWMPEINNTISWYPMSLFWCRNFSWWDEFFFSKDFRSGRLVAVFQMKFGAGEFGGGNKNSPKPCGIWKPSLPIHILRQCFVVKFGSETLSQKKRERFQLNGWDKNPWDIWRHHICGILSLWFLVFQSSNLMEWSWVTLLVMHHNKASKVWNSWNLQLQTSIRLGIICGGIYLN